MFNVLFKVNLKIYTDKLNREISPEGGQCWQCRPLEMNRQRMEGWAQYPESWGWQDLTRSQRQSRRHRRNRMEA